MDRHPALGGGLAENLAETPELGVGQEPLAPARRILAHRPARVGAVGDHLPVRGHRVHARHQRHRPVRRVGNPAQPDVERRHPLALHREQWEFAELRHEVLAEQPPDAFRRGRLAAHRDMLLHVARGQAGHRRPAREPGRQRLRNRVLARLDPVDDPRRPAPRLVSGDHPVPAHRHPHRLSFRPALHDDDPAAAADRLPQGRDPEPAVGPGGPGGERVALARYQDGAADDFAVGGSRAGARGDPARGRQPVRDPGKDEGKTMRKLNDPWDIVCERAGLEDMRLHDCRHSYASRALALGESLPMIGRLLGHTHVQTTARYAHLARDSIQNAAARITGSIGGNLSSAQGSENH